MHRTFICLALSLACFMSTGCALPAYIAHAFEKDKMIGVDAQYRGIGGKKVAVLAIAGKNIVRGFPNIQREMCIAITRRMAESHPDCSFVDPEQIEKYQDENPYWNTLPYKRLTDSLKVDRVIYVDLSEYRTHEVGNEHMKRGYCSGGIGVVEAENPDKFDFYIDVHVRYPHKGEIGLVNVPDRSIELATISEFSTKVSHLFVDHQERKYPD